MEFGLDPLIDLNFLKLSFVQRWIREPAESVRGQSRVLSVTWGSVGVGFGVRYKAPSPPGSCRSVHDA